MAKIIPLTPPFNSEDEHPILDWILKFILRIWIMLWKRWPFKVFIVYIFFIFAFAYVYQRIHTYQPRSFAFQSDIVKAKNEELKTTLQQEMNTMEANLQIIRRLPDVLEKTKDVPAANNAFGNDSFSFFSDKYEFAFDVSPYSDKSGAKHVVFYILVPGKIERWGPTKDMLAEEGLYTQYPWPYPLEAFREMTSTLISRYEVSINQKRARLESLNEYTPDYWSYFDFLYFSTITQATVGYGDILPNSTLVRFVVVTQTLLGLFHFGVAINFASAEVEKVVRDRIGQE